MALHRENVDHLVRLVFEMVKPKFRTQNKFLGRRKRKTKRPRESEEKSAPTTDTVHKKEMKSASAKKMRMLEVALEEGCTEGEDVQKDDEDHFLFAQKSSLNKLIASLLCPNCQSNGLRIDIDVEKSFGFSLKGQLFCNSCDAVIEEGFLCGRVDKEVPSKVQVPFEVNVRATVAFRGIGAGHSAMKEWCSLMNLPSCLSKLAHQNLQQKLVEGSKVSFEKVAQKSVKAIKQAYADVGEFPDQEGVLNIGVSFDGSWQRRGHSSHNGIGVVIDLMTGLPVDYEVLSNVCNKCKEGPKEGEDGYETWIQEHRPKCQKNFDGSSNAMESKCATNIWQRSVDKLGLRYTTMLSDGDSKSFDAVSKINVYGDTEISKEDCVNHVSKRMGAALRNLKAEAKAAKKPIGGKGKLTDEKVVKIQNYYGRAIKDNAGDTELMKKRIFAILFHMTSTDDNPKHVHCPPGEKSWCFWQRAIAKEEEPGQHKEHDTLPFEVGQMLVPIFQRLTEKRLLDRCRYNRTQNPNESLHNIVWRFCPKINYAGKNTVECATCLALCQFSMGSTFKVLLYEVLGISPGKYLEAAARKRSLERIRKAEKASEEAVKKQRRRLRYDKSGRSRTLKAEEGETYKSGSFE